MWAKISLGNQNIQSLIEKYEAAKADLLNALQRESLIVGEEKESPTGSNQ
jgi:hypothetical protein